MGGLALKAQHYPKALCKAMITGAEEDSAAWRQVWATEGENEEEEKELEDALDEEVEAAGAPVVRLGPPKEVGEDALGEAEEDVIEGGMNREDKKLVQKLHNNLGHPGRYEFCRALRMARARPEVWRYVKNEFRCGICDSQQKPKVARPGTVPRTFEAGHTVGVDVVFFPALEPRQNVPVLNITDWGTGYQSLEPLDSMSSEHVWMKFHQCWIRIFGVPQLAVMDQGREFVGSFSKKLAESGCLVKVIGARSPWQQGRTERHGGLAKETFIKVMEEILPSSKDEWKTCVYAVEAAKNRLYNRSGFSPAQRQLGCNLRLPGSLGSDDPCDPQLLVHCSSEDMRRSLQIRQSAMEAFLKQTATEVVQRSALARPRVSKSFEVGDIVYVYRVPLRRRGDGAAANRPQWVGPGTVLMIEGANVWISMRGELWKCAREQVRKATCEEQDAADMLKQEFIELKEHLRRGRRKRSFQDISSWGTPPVEDDPPAVEPPQQRPRVEAAEPEAAPAAAPQDTAIPEDSSSSSSSSSSPSTSEPEGEGSDGMPKGPVDPELAQAIRSVQANEQLDGTRRPRDGQRGLYEPTRRAWESRREARWIPYRGGATIEEEEEEDTLVAHDDEGQAALEEDVWIYDEERKKVIRLHQHARRAKFTPSHTRGCPIPVGLLTSQRKTYKVYGDGSRRMESSDWRAGLGKKEEGALRWWTGYTEFSLRKVAAEVHLMVKRGSDEVLEKDILSEEEWEKWRVADGAEWSKVEATGAVRTMSVEESEEVSRQLHEAGLQSRILPSRMVRRWEPADQPGQPPSRKSRWCVRGDRDPDLLDLTRHAPTVTTATLSIVLQIAASFGWRTAIGDLKNAFMQSDRLVRPSGRLFCRQPNGGLPGLHSQQLVEILAGAYGLGDAPAHWRKTLKRAIFDLGLTQSVMDPTVYKWFHRGKLEGILVVEVDDLMILGTGMFFKHMEQLRARFEFGKFVFVDETPEGTSFNGRRIRVGSKKEFLVDMQKFIEERLKTVPIAKGRKAEDFATPEERDLTRAAVGSITWTAKEGHPDAAAIASLVASNLTRLSVQDIRDLNKAIDLLKSRSDLCLRIQPIRPERLGWGVITDVSFANASQGKSQGAYAVVAYDVEVLERGEGRCNLLHWRSGKIQRVANSTLAAETQSMSRGLGELSWTVTVFNELTTLGFDLKQWEKSLQDRRLRAFASDASDEELVQGICVVDAKLLFAHLSKETTGVTADKHTGLEMQVIRPTLAETGTRVKWVPHPQIVVDCLTKRQGNAQPLLDLLDNGILKVTKPNNNYWELSIK